MIRLVLLRHAKSSWRDASLSDHDRPLNARGRHAAQQMAEAVAVRGLQPDTILCSTATRARQTLTPLLNQLDGSIALTISHALYEATASDYPNLIRHLAATSKAPKTILLVGHNFAIQDAAINLAIPDDTDTLLKLKNKFPSGAAAIMDLQTDLTECGPASARLFDFIRPRDL